jgi:hypothetical protein
MPPTTRRGADDADAGDRQVPQMAMAEQRREHDR